jgi:hypothetical protein
VLVAHTGGREPWRARTFGPQGLTALQPVPFGFEVDAPQHSARVPPSHAEGAARRQRDLHRAAYTRIGFAEVGMFATVLLDESPPGGISCVGEQLVDRPLVIGMLAILGRDHRSLAIDQKVCGKAEVATC